MGLKAYGHSVQCLSGQRYLQSFNNYFFVAEFPAALPVVFYASFFQMAMGTSFNHDTVPLAFDQIGGDDTLPAKTSAAVPPNGSSVQLFVTLSMCIPAWLCMSC